MSEAYYEIKNFAAGMDTRKSALTSPAGTLRLLKNCHITPGGEIDKRQAFVQFASAPGDTVGLVSMGDFVYGLGAGGANIPATINSVGRLALAMPGGVSIKELLDWDTYAGKFFVIVRGSDLAVYHFYDGAYVADAKGTACRTYKTKMYTVDGDNLRFSAVGDPADWAGTGAGFIDLSAEDADMENLQSIEAYYDKIAVVSKTACQIWFIDPDPNKNSLFQTLRQAGTYAPRSIRQYGSGDVLYLSADGIRSLKARQTSLTASVSDIGSPIDLYVRDLLRTNFTSMPRANSLLEPLSGRYWIVLQDKILVLSNYPSPSISAWCVYEPGFNIADATPAGNFIYLRATNGMVYRYGGGAGPPVYDNCAVEVIMPFLSFEKPATFKQFDALDFSATGQWQVYAAMNPHNEDAEDLLGTINGPTFLTGQFPMAGTSTHISLRLRSNVSGPCTLSNVMIHYRSAQTT